MVLAGRKALIVLFVWGAASILFLGSWGYSLFVRADLAASPRFLGERLLYAGIVCACVFLVLFFRLFLRSRGVIRELDRLVELSKHGGLPSSAGLRKLGKVGEKIARLYTQINELNDKRGLRIGAMSALIDLLMGSIEIPLLVTDVMGTILHASREYLDRRKVARVDVVGASMEDLFAEVVMAEIVFEIGKSHTTVEKTVSKGSLFCSPVYDRNHDLSFLLFVFEKKTFPLIGDLRPRIQVPGEEPKKGFIRQFVSGVIGKRKRRIPDEG
jgi:hypothetical protein